MKIAIIGSGFMALKSAKHFLELGAEIRIFKASQNWGGLLKNKTIQSLENSDQSLLDFGGELDRLGLVKSGKVLRVQKRFLAPGVQPVTRSRFADLFRIIYQIDAKKIVAENREEQKEIFDKLDDNIIESLKTSVEAYEDFDVVFDATGPIGKPMPLGSAGAPALNENAIKDHEHIFYGRDTLKAANDLQASWNEKKFKDLVFIGDGILNLIALNEMKEFFFTHENINLHFICSSLAPFTHIEDCKYAKLINGFKDLIDRNEKNYQNEIEDFNKRVVEWKNLESHVRMKKPRPVEPRPRLMIYNGATVTSVDKLLDREGLFLTIEGSELLGTSEQMLTIPASRLLVDNGSCSELSYDKIIDDQEVGFYKLRFDHDIIEAEVSLMKLFSKAEEQ